MSRTHIVPILSTKKGGYFRKVSIKEAILAKKRRTITNCVKLEGQKWGWQNPMGRDIIGSGPVGS